MNVHLALLDTWVFSKVLCNPKKIVLYIKCIFLKMSVCVANKNMGSESLQLSQFRVSTRFFRILRWVTYLAVSKNIASLTFVTFQCLTNFCPITKFLIHILELPLLLYLLSITEKLKRKVYFWVFGCFSSLFNLNILLIFSSILCQIKYYANWINY